MTNQFSVEGTITKKFVSESGKFAKIGLNVPTEGKRFPIRMDIKSFSMSVIKLIKESLDKGSSVKVTGTIENKKLTDKTGADVVVDDYPVYVSELVASEIVDLATGETQNPDDGRVPF